jgi:hypothetical protein
MADPWLLLYFCKGYKEFDTGIDAVLLQALVYR